MAYANRTDLNNPAGKIAVQTAKGQTYGEATKQEAAQRAVPMGAPEQPPAVAPGGLGSFNRSTERPQEPITAGVNFGDGMNAQQANVNQVARNSDPVLARLQYLYDNFPNEDLADLLDSYVNDGY
jgi:hypothetical protein